MKIAVSPKFVGKAWSTGNLISRLSIMFPRDVLLNKCVDNKWKQHTTLEDVTEFGTMIGHVLTVVMEIDATFSLLSHQRP